MFSYKKTPAKHMFSCISLFSAPPHYIITDKGPVIVNALSSVCFEHERAVVSSAPFLGTQGVCVCVLDSSSPVIGTLPLNFSVVQFWIGAVLILGFLEKTFFVSEYSNINQGADGESATVTSLVPSLLRPSIYFLFFSFFSLMGGAWEWG